MSVFDDIDEYDDLKEQRSHQQQQTIAMSKTILNTNFQYYVDYRIDDTQRTFYKKYIVEISAKVPYNKIVNKNNNNTDSDSTDENGNIYFENVDEKNSDFEINNNNDTNSDFTFQNTIIHPLLKLDFSHVNDKNNKDIKGFVEKVIKSLDEYVSLIQQFDNDDCIEITFLNSTFLISYDILTMKNLEKGQSFCLLYNSPMLNGQNLQEYIDFFNDHQHSIEDVSNVLTMNSVQYYHSPSFPYSYDSSSQKVANKIKDKLMLVEGFEDFKTWYFILRCLFFNISYADSIKTKNELLNDGRNRSNDSNGNDFNMMLPLADKEQYIDENFYAYYESHIYSDAVKELLNYDNDFAITSFDKFLQGLTALTALQLYDNKKIHQFFLHRIIDFDDDKEKDQKQNYGSNVRADVFKILLNNVEQEKLKRMTIEYFESPALKGSAGESWVKTNKDNLYRVAHITAVVLLTSFGISAIDQFSIASRDFINLAYLTIVLPENYYTSHHLKELIKTHEKVKHSNSYDQYMEAVDLYIEQEGTIPASLCFSMIGEVEDL